MVFGGTGRAPVEYRDYRARLLRTMHAFARGRQFSDDMFDSDLTDPQRPPVFRPSHRDQNLILPADNNQLADFVRASLPAGARHRWFGSMMSSQALAQSVFGALLGSNRLDLLSRVRAEGGELAFEGLTQPDEAKLEKEVDWLGEMEGRGTSVDVFFESPGYRIAVECKLSEREFGACSRPGLDEDNPDLCDGSYTVQLERRGRCSLTERDIAYWSYIPAVLGWRDDEDHIPCPARYTYQLVRNLLAALVHEGQVRLDRGHVVVVYDARNPSFYPSGPARTVFEQVAEALGDQANRLRLVSWQSIISVIAGAEELTYLGSGLQAKYGLTAPGMADPGPFAESGGRSTLSAHIERMRETLFYARDVLRRVSADGGVLDQLGQVNDDELAEVDPATVSKLTARLDQVAELARSIRAEDIAILLR
jgi:hypothetical protein